MRQVGAGQVQHVQVGGQQKQVVASGNSKVNQKPIKDPNAPKKPLSAYFLFRYVIEKFQIEIKLIFSTLESYQYLLFFAAKKRG